MPGKLADKNPRNRLEHALKTRTTLSSEFSSDLRGRNLALVSGAKKQVKTWYLKQQMAVKDMEATKVRLIAARSMRRSHLKRYASDADLSQWFENPAERPVTPKIRKNSEILLLERQLTRQRELFGFQNSFRTVNLYKVDQKSGEIVRTFDAMPVECLFPNLSIADKTERNEKETNVPATAKAQSAPAGGAGVSAGDDGEKDDEDGDDDDDEAEGEDEDKTEKMAVPQSSRVLTTESFLTDSSSFDLLASRQKARGEDKFDILQTQPGLRRTLSSLNGKMKSFIGQLELELTTEAYAAEILKNDI